MKESEFMIIELKTHYWLRSGLTKFVGLFQKYLDLWGSFLTIFALLMNFIVITSYDNENSERTEDPEFFNLDPTETRKLLNG